MKLTHLQARNYIGAVDIDLKPSAPIVLLAGDNGAGKTSLRDAIESAIRGKATRVEHKKDYHELVTDGASKSGMVSVAFDAGVASFEIPSGKGGSALNVDQNALPYVLNPNLFAALDATGRRKFLFALTDCSASKDEIIKRMTAKGIADAMIQAVLPTLSSQGFEAASKFCANKATESKGSWRAVTGKNWGAVAGAEFKMEVADFDVKGYTELKQRLAECEKDLQAAIRKEGEIAGRADAKAKRAQQLESLRASVALIEEVEKEEARLLSIARTKEEAANAATEALNAVSERVRQAQSGSAAAAGKSPPRLLERAMRLLEVTESIIEYREDDPVGKEFHSLKADYAAEYPPEPAKPEPVPQSLLDEQAAATDALARADDELEQAAAAHQSIAERLIQLRTDERALKTLESQTDEDGGDADAAEHAAYTQRLRDSLEGLEDNVNELRALEADFKKATETNDKAAKYHGDVVGWDAAAKALAPDGIQAEIVGEALAPVNNVLRTCSSLSGWPQVSIDADMVIRVGGRLYSLLSESERWRSDAMLAVAIANLSGIRWVLLDRVDVNSVKNRGALIGLMDDLVDQNHLDGALMLGTFQRCPSELSENYSVFWIEKGRIVEGELK